MNTLVRRRDVAVLRFKDPENNHPIQWLGPLDTIHNGPNDATRFILQINTSSTSLILTSIAFDRIATIEMTDSDLPDRVKRIFKPSHDTSRALLVVLEENLRCNRLWRKVSTYVDPRKVSSSLSS